MYRAITSTQATHPFMYPCIHPPVFISMHHLSLLSVCLYHLPVSTISPSPVPSINLPSSKLFSCTTYHEATIFIHPSSHHLLTHPPTSTIYPVSASTIIYESIAIYHLSTYHFYQSIHTQSSYPFIYLCDLPIRS